MADLTMYAKFTRTSGVPAEGLALGDIDFYLTETDKVTLADTVSYEERHNLANGEDKPSRNSYEDLRWNEDGSIDLYIGPTPPEGYGQNWVKTLPDQGWQILIRLYGPLETYFDYTWKPDDFIRTD